MTTSAVGLPQSSGVEMRVHGVGGGHEVFRALGRPVYKETADARVRVGSLPRLPKHELKLINWSRPRKISGNLSWYLAYPFTVLNVAGYMGPERSEDRSEKRLWWFMRAGIVVSSLMMTFAMAAWITVILETGWRLLGGTAEGLSTTILGAFAPGLLAAFIVNRMVRGRPLADKGNCWVSLLNLAVLLGTAVYLAGRPASKDAIFDFGDANARDPMTLMIITTTVVMWTFALALCFIAWRAEYSRRQHDWAEPDRTALAGAGILIALAIAILHTGGSILRLALQTVLKYAPPGIEPLTYDPRVHAVLLPPPDDLEPRAVVPTRDYFTQLLPIDLVPVFFLATVAILGVLVWREFRLRKPKFSEESTHSLARKQVAPFHVVIEETHEFLARTGIVAMVGSIGVWLVLAAAVFAASNHGWGKDEWVVPLMVGLKIAGLILLVIIVARRPAHVAYGLRHLFGSLADIAGFWAPDLHPLAAASYRRAVLRGIRIGIRDVREDHPGKPIALVGHSQGSVICAWFVRGGHWNENEAESRSDEEGLAMGLHQVPREQSDRIALFSCGSPLVSLYSTFFPRYFNDDFFRTALKMSYGNIWYNYWRQTDPIGSKLSGHNATTHGDGPQVQDIDVTELANEETRGHCEYWQDDRIRRDVEAYFAFFGLVKKWHNEFNDLTRQQDPPITNTTVRMVQSDKATISFDCGGEPFTHTISYRLERFERQGRFYRQGWEPFPGEIVPGNGHRRVWSATADEYLETEHLATAGNGRQRRLRAFVPGRLHVATHHAGGNSHLRWLRVSIPRRGHLTGN